MCQRPRRGDVQEGYRGKKEWGEQNAVIIIISETKAEN
jgi:hypothetical protein